MEELVMKDFFLGVVGVAHSRALEKEDTPKMLFG